MFIIYNLRPYFINNKHYTGCNRRNGPNFGRVFLMLNYTEKKKPKTPMSKV